MEHKRLTLFAGHYGSGKTNIAVNYALHLAAEGKQVCIGDLDIVNPYFRTKDSAADLAAAGVELISPQFANSNVDLPALPAECYRLVQDFSTYGIMDIGGDDRGAYALGRFVPSIVKEGNYRMIYVANCYRPLTRTPEDTLEVMREIEAACGLKFTDIVNNSNLGSGHMPARAVDISSVSTQTRPSTSRVTPTLNPPQPAAIGAYWLIPARPAVRCSVVNIPPRQITSRVRDI